MKIQKNKVYYNQNDIEKEIHKKTGCSSSEIHTVINALGDVVKDKFSDMDSYVELKIFPGLKVISKYIQPEQSKSNLNLDNKFVLSLSSVFTDDFRKKVKELHNSIE